MSSQSDQLERKCLPLSLGWVSPLHILISTPSLDWIVNPNVFVFKFASTFLWLGVIKAIPCPSFLGRRQTLRGYRPTFSQETRLKPGFMTCVFGAWPWPPFWRIKHQNPMSMYYNYYIIHDVIRLGWAILLGVVFPPARPAKAGVKMPSIAEEKKGRNRYLMAVGWALVCRAYL